MLFQRGSKQGRKGEAGRLGWSGQSVGQQPAHEIFRTAAAASGFAGFGERSWEDVTHLVIRHTDDGRHSPAGVSRAWHLLELLDEVLDTRVHDRIILLEVGKDLLRLLRVPEHPGRVLIAPLL